MRKHSWSIIVMLALWLSAFVAAGQTNLWTNQISGKWEVATNWSLGVAPSTNQAILLTNTGSEHRVRSQCRGRQTNNH